MKIRVQMLTRAALAGPGRWSDVAEFDRETDAWQWVERARLEDRRVYGLARTYCVVQRTGVREWQSLRALRPVSVEAMCAELDGFAAELQGRQ